MPDIDGTASPLVLEVSGDLDVASAGELVTRGEALMDGAPVGQRVVIDLAEVRFIDSSGLSGLLRLRRVAVAQGRPISLRRTPRSVATLLSLSGIDSVLPSE